MNKNVRYGVKVSLDRWLTGDRFEMTTSDWEKRKLIEERDEALIVALTWKRRDPEARVVRVTRRTSEPNGDGTEKET